MMTYQLSSKENKNAAHVEVPDHKESLIRLFHRKRNSYQPVPDRGSLILQLTDHFVDVKKLDYFSREHDAGVQSLMVL